MVFRRGTSRGARRRSDAVRISHPPAGATTLIVSLELLTRVDYLVAIEAAAVLLTAQAWVINRAAGLPYPLWEAREERGG